MSKIVRNVALLALLAEPAKPTKLIQKSIMSLQDLKPPQKSDELSPSDLSLLQSKFLTYGQADSIDLDDEPKFSSMSVSPPPPAPNSNNRTLA